MIIFQQNTVISSDLVSLPSSAVCGEVSAPPLAVRWGHLRLPRRGPVSAVDQQHQRAAYSYQYDSMPTHVHLARLWAPQNNRVLPVPLSQQTQTPAGLHQPLRWEEEGRTHLRAKGRAAVCTGRHPHARHRFVLSESLPVCVCAGFVALCCGQTVLCPPCRHSDRVCQPRQGSPENEGRAEAVWRVRVSTVVMIQTPLIRWRHGGWTPPCRVVCVGGDGMFSEIIHGLIWRTQADNARNLNSPEETLLPCSLRIGIIPAGQK